MAEQELTRQQKLGQARNAAVQRLIKANESDFNALMQQEADARGVEWAPRKTEEQRAAEEMAALLERFPNLRQQIETTQAVPVSPVSQVS